MSMSALTKMGLVLGLLLSSFAVKAATTYTTVIYGSTWSYTLSVAADATTNATITAVSPADGALIVPSQVDGYRVKFIGNGVGKGCANITKLAIPDTIKSIGAGAFANCTSLGDVVIGNGVSTIAGIDNTSNYIQDYAAFGYCTSLTNVTFGSSLKEIGGYAFYGCTSLSDVSIPDSVTAIKHRAFYGCSKMTTATFGKGLVSMGVNSFRSCSGLKRATFADGGTTGLVIGEGVFADCGWLEEIDLPDNLSSIYDRAFSGCTSLKALLIPDSVRSIGAGVFANCTSLGDVVIGNGVSTIAGIDNTSNFIQDYAAFGYCTSLTNVTFGSSLKEIGGYAFYGCTSLSRVSIPDSVTTIKHRAFYGCSKMVEVMIGNKLSNMGDYAFARCLELKKVHFVDGGATGLTLNEGVFSSCTVLTDLHLPNNILSVGNNAFSGSSAYKAQ